MSITGAPRMPRIPDKRCDAPGCNETVASSHVMCRHHWQMVPVWLRRQIFNATTARDWKKVRSKQARAVEIVGNMQRRGRGRRTA